MPKNPAQPDASLYAYLAREASVGVILRRGPSKHVQMIKWNTRNDTFEEGQWFKGRIYERRCDLSPGGRYFIYFAANYKKPLYSWTAISKPPYFTALALWPKGDGWNGGGYFLRAHVIHLNHASMTTGILRNLPCNSWTGSTPTRLIRRANAGRFFEASIAHPDFVKNCLKFQIQSYAAQRGEDSPIWDTVLRRNGWQFVQDAIWGEYEDTRRMAWKAKRPLIWRKRGPGAKLILEMAIEGIGERGKRWYVSHYRLQNEKSGGADDLGILDWADWDKQGDLLFARCGKLFRQKIHNKRRAECREIADFSASRFEAVKAPDSAKEL